MDHFNGRDAVTQSLKDRRLELFRHVEDDLMVGSARRIQFIKYWRHKFQTHLYEARHKRSEHFTRQLQESLPFIIGKAIMISFERQIRFGKEMVSYRDKKCSQVYQVVFMELVGFKVDSVFVQGWLEKHTIRTPKLSQDVLNFMQNKVGSIKEHAIGQYKVSRNPLEKLEYKLNSLIGPKKLHDRIVHAHEQAQPTDEALSHVLESDVFSSPIIDEICLFPKPITKFDLMH